MRCPGHTSLLAWTLSPASLSYMWYWLACKDSWQVQKEEGANFCGKVVSHSPVGGWHLGRLVVDSVAWSGTPTCPVVMVEQYCVRAALDLKSPDFLFQGIVYTKKGEKLGKSGHVSYTRAQELMLKRLSDLGYDALKLVCIASGQEELQQQLMQKSQTSSLSAMGTGAQKLKRMVT